MVPLPSPPPQSTSLSIAPYLHIQTVTVWLYSISKVTERPQCNLFLLGSPALESFPGASSPLCIQVVCPVVTLNSEFI